MTSVCSRLLAFAAALCLLGTACGGREAGQWVEEMIPVRDRIYQ